MFYSLFYSRHSIVRSRAYYDGVGLAPKGELEPAQPPLNPPLDITLHRWLRTLHGAPGPNNSITPAVALPEILN